MTPDLYSASPELIADFDRVRQRALVIGIVGLALCAIGWVVNPEQFYRSYLVGFLFCGRATAEELTGAEDVTGAVIKVSEASDPRSPWRGFS